MNTDEIKKMLDKYFMAKTSTEEEVKLAEYFNNQEIDSDLLPYASLFRYFSHEKQTKAPENAGKKLFELQKKSAKKRNIINWSSIAATLLIVLTIGVYFNKKDNPNTLMVMYSNGKLIDDPAQAFDFVSKELKIISETVLKTGSMIESSGAFRKIKIFESEK